MWPQAIPEGGCHAGRFGGRSDSVPAGLGQTLPSESFETDSKDFAAYGKRSRFVISARTLGARTGRLTPLQDSVGIITPSALHFENTRGYPPPDIDPRQQRLLIHGLVDRPLIFTLEELQCLPSVSRIYFVECGGNSGVRTWSAKLERTVQQVHGKTSCSEWTGVPLALLLREAGIQKGASWLVAEGADAGKHFRSIPLEKALDDILVAYGQNGEPLRPEQGYPLRLLVPGWEGNFSVKWLRRIKVVDQPYMGRNDIAPLLQNTDGRAPLSQFVRPPRSVITRPSAGHRLPGRGFYEITGLAWSGGGAIRRVEVSTDDGRSWNDAKLQEPVLRFAHTRFRLEWNWDGEETVLQSRCTDEQGRGQQTLAELGGIHALVLDEMDGRLSNYIQPWKVTREGNVENPLV